MSERRCDACQYWRRGTRLFGVAGGDVWSEYDKKKKRPFNYGHCCIRSVEQNTMPKRYEDDYCHEFRRREGIHPGYRQSGSMMAD